MYIYCVYVCVCVFIYIYAYVIFICNLFLPFIDTSTILHTETLKIKANFALCTTYHRNIYYKDKIFFIL